MKSRKRCGLCWFRLRSRFCGLGGKTSDLDDELWVGVRKALELILVQIHDEELVGGRQIHSHLGELFVEIANVSAGFLNKKEKL